MKELHDWGAMPPIGCDVDRLRGLTLHVVVSRRLKEDFNESMVFWFRPPSHQTVIELIKLSVPSGPIYDSLHRPTYSFGHQKRSRTSPRPRQTEALESVVVGRVNRRDP